MTAIGRRGWRAGGFTWRRRFERSRQLTGSYQFASIAAAAGDTGFTGSRVPGGVSTCASNLNGSKIA